MLEKLSNPFAERVLWMHRFLLRTAFAVSNVFGWIFVFEYFFAIQSEIGIAFSRTVLMYAFVSTVTCLLVPFSATKLRKGMRSQMMWGVVFVAIAYTLLGATFTGLFGIYSFVAVVGFGICMGVYRALYWIPYEVERYALGKRRARLLYEILIALAPVSAGYLMLWGSVPESMLLFGAVVLMILSLLPLMIIPDTYESFVWRYRETFGELFMPAHRRLLVGAMIDGVQGTGVLLVWPIIIFLVVGWSYTLFGLLLSISFLSIILMRGRVAHTPHPIGIFNSLPIRIAIVSSAWMGRLFVANPFSIIIMHLYERTAGQVHTTIDHSAHEQSADVGHFVDEYSTLREMGLSLGRMALCVVIAIVASTFSIYVACVTAFVLIAISASVSMVLSQPSSRVSL